MALLIQGASLKMLTASIYNPLSLTITQRQTQIRKIYFRGVIYFGYGIKFSNLEIRIGQKATYKVVLGSLANCISFVELTHQNEPLLINSFVRINRFQAGIMLNGS